MVEPPTEVKQERVGCNEREQSWYGEALEWVDWFTYLGFPIYARGHSPGGIPPSRRGRFSVVLYLLVSCKLRK